MAALLACRAACGAVTAHAEIPPELDGRPVVAVEVLGEAAAIVSVVDIGIPHGSALSRPLIRAAVLRLLHTGRFTDVQIDGVPEGDGVRLQITLLPRIVIDRVDIAGQEHVPEQPIRDALRVSEGATVLLGQLEAQARAVSRLYAERGFLGAEVEVSLRDTDDPSHKVLMVRIAEGAPTRLRSILFDGEQPVDPVAVLAVMESSVGSVLDRTGLAKDAQTAESWLREQGYLEAELGDPLVTIEGQTARVTIPSHVGPRYRVEITGCEPYAPSELFEALQIGREALTPLQLRTTFGERGRDFFARRGFPDASVRIYAARGAKPGTAVLAVRVRPGKQLRVVSVSFAGARHFSRGFLEDQLLSYLAEELPGSTVFATVDSEVADELHAGEAAGRRRSVPRPPITDPGEIFYAPAYEKATGHIVELYREQGYQSAKLGPLRVERIGEDRAAVLIPVVEGPQTRLFEVRLRGASAISPREVLALSNLRQGDPFSHVALDQARRRILDAYHDRGHAFAKVDARVRTSSDGTRAEVELEVVEGVPVTVDRIVIRGADRTSHPLIRRVMRIEAGDLFRPQAARESERELGSLGVFSSASVALEDPELPARVKSVVVTVSERHNQFLDFGAGLSTGQGLRGGFEYGYRNLFEQAVSMTLRVQLAYQLFFVDREIEARFDALPIEDRLERRVSLGTTIPRTPLLGRVRTSIDLVHLRDNERDFGLDQNAIGLTFSHSPLQQLTLTFGSDLENNYVDLFVAQALADYLKQETNQRLRKLLRVPQGNSTLVALRTSIGYDKRDSAFVPTRGFFASASAELARTLTGDRDELGAAGEFESSFLKLSTTASGYVPVGSVVLAGQARIGRIIHLTEASQTYPNRAFFLGGVDTMRGFLEDELIPADVAERIALDPELDPNAVVRAGDAFVLFRGEIRFPLYGQLSGGVFSDFGNLWADAANLDPLQLRPTAGVGLRLGTPVGPIALDWGWNLAPRAVLSERTNAVHFSIGLF